MSTAIVFPGMGPQDRRQLKKYALLDPAARALFDEADAAVGRRILDWTRGGEDDYAEDVQLAFALVCLASARRALADAGGVELCASVSFGVKPLLAFAGCLDLADTVRVIDEINDLATGFFATSGQDLLTCSLARTAQARVDELIDAVRADGGFAEVSGRMDDDFWMVTTTETGADALEGGARAAGGMPFYRMDPPMHSSALAPLRADIAAALQAYDFRDPAIPVVHDRTGQVLRHGTQLRDMVADSYVMPVDWPAAVTTLRSHGVDELCVAGPDSLVSRVACTRRAFTVRPYDAYRALHPVA